MRYFWALVRRHFHCLFNLHRSVDLTYFDEGETKRSVMCECGKVFYDTVGPELRKLLLED